MPSDTVVKRFVKEWFRDSFSLLASQPRSVSRPFVSLTQDGGIAEKGKNRVKNKGKLLPQRHLTAEYAEEGMVERQ